jgi:hypothetical protein
MRRTGGRLIVVLVATALALAACGSDKKSTSTTNTTAPPGTTVTTAPSTDAKFLTVEQVKDSWKLYADTPPGIPLPHIVKPDESASVKRTLVPKADVNGDGKVVIGIATVGDSHDQGFYQSFIDKAKAFVDRYKSEGWSLIVVDRVNPADAGQQVKNLCQQGADLVALGDSQLADAIPAYQSSECANSKAYVNAGSGVKPQEFLSEAEDRVDPLLYVAGVAAGLVLKEQGGTKAGFVTGPELDFSKAAA